MEQGNFKMIFGGRTFLLFFLVGRTSFQHRILVIWYERSFSLLKKVLKKNKIACIIE